MQHALVSALYSGALFVAIGLFGTLVETVGKIADAPRIESAGRAIEAFAVDAPKAFSGLVNVAKGLKL